tara:strand:+ start:421 stop:633 length:213 start_codon:yes stop_codon:yes gene_type:complete
MFKRVLWGLIPVDGRGVFSTIVALFAFMVLFPFAFLIDKGLIGHGSELARILLLFIGVMAFWIFAWKNSE